MSKAQTAPVDQVPGAKRKVTEAEKRMYHESVRGGLVFRAKFKREEHWRNYIRILAHNWHSGDTLEADTPTVNLLASRVRQQPPRLAFGTPNFELTPWVRHPNPNAAAANAAMLSMLWENEGFDDVTRQITLDWPTFGFGVGFVGFERGYEGEILDQKRKLFGMASPEFTERISRMLGGKICDLLSTRESQSLKMLLRKRLFLERVAPLNFVIDPCASSWGDAQFMARRLFLPKERARIMFGDACPAADSISNIALYQGTADEDPFNDTDSYNGIDPHEIPDTVKRVAVWELWHIGTRSTVYLDRRGQVIGDHVHEWRSPHPGFPFCALIWDDIPDVVYPEGLAAAAYSLNKELHLFRKRKLQEAGKAHGNVFVRTDDPQVDQKLKRAKSGEYIRLPADAEIDVASMQLSPPQFWSETEHDMRVDLDEVTLTSPYGSGGMPVVKRTATEAAQAQSGADVMIAYRQFMVERWAAEVAERMLAHITTLFDEPIPLEIVNQDPDYVDPETGQPAAIGQLVPYHYVGIDHGGYWRIKVTDGSMVSYAKDVERQQFREFIELNVNYGIPGFKLEDAMKHYAGLMSSVRDPQRFYATAQEIEAQQQEAAAAQPAPGAPAPDGYQQMLAGMPQQMAGAPALPPGSGNPQADLLASVFGGQAPLTGPNGMGGAS